MRVRFPEKRPEFPRGIRFVDAESPETREALRPELAEILAYHGYRDLDAATVRTKDRRVTRWIGQWVYDQADETGRALYAGISYVSRLDSAWECWAVFGDVVMEEISQQSILLGDAALSRVARRYGLTIR